MYVIAHHRFTNSPQAFERGVKLIKNEGAPAGTTGLQFYPSTDGSQAICLWETESVADVQKYADDTLGDANVNTVWEKSTANKHSPTARSDSSHPRRYAAKTLARNEIRGPKSSGMT